MADQHEREGEAMIEEKQASFEGWARVEVMGHQTHIGFVRTEGSGSTTRVVALDASMSDVHPARGVLR